MIYGLVRIVQVTVGTASYRRLDIAFAALFCLLLLATFINLERNPFRIKCLIWLASLFLINGMLLFLSPISARCAFISFTLILMWTMDMAYGQEQKGVLPVWLKSLLAAACGAYAIGLLACYWQNHKVYTEMSVYAQMRLEEGADTLYLPMYERDWLIQDGNSLIYYMYSYYRVAPGDVQIVLVPYEDWEK